MIIGLSRAGLGQVGSLERFVTMASEYGFGAVDAGGQELEEWLAEAGLEAAQTLLREKKVQIGSIGLSPEWRHSEEAFREGLPRLVKDAEAANRLGVTRCCTYVLPSTDYNAAHFMALATRRLRTVAEILDAYGIRLGLEFVGPHHLRTRWANPFIWDLPSILDWIDAIGKRNVGLLLDSYHWHTTGACYEEIVRLRAEQIVHVHINDAKNVPVPEALDNDRLYPGEGVIDLVSFLKGFQAIGYEGVVAQEVLTPQPPAESSEELLARSRQGFAKVFHAAGLQQG